MLSKKWFNCGWFGATRLPGAAKGSSRPLFAAQTRRCWESLPTSDSSQVPGPWVALTHAKQTSLRSEWEKSWNKLKPPTHLFIPSHYSDDLRRDQQQVASNLEVILDYDPIGITVPSSNLTGQWKKLPGDLHWQRLNWACPELGDAQIYGNQIDRTMRFYVSSRGSLGYIPWFWTNQRTSPRNWPGSFLPNLLL